MNISKLIVKELIETSLKFGRMLDSDHMPLQHFFIVLEHVLRHGLRPKKVQQTLTVRYGHTYIQEKEKLSKLFPKQIHLATFCRNEFELWWLVIIIMTILSHQHEFSTNRAKPYNLLFVNSKTLEITRLPTYFQQLK